MESFNRWLNTPAGRYLFEKEKKYFDHAVRDIFGFRAVQYGCSAVDLLSENRMPWRCVMTQDEGKSAVRGVPWALPFASESVDLLVLPHTFDIYEHPHQILREVSRVLVPEGRVVLTGFNPYSLWGIARYGCSAQQWPCRGRFLALSRLRDWLTLLEFELSGGAFLGYAPLFRSEAAFARCRWLDDAGDRWWPLAGAVYALEAVKRRYGGHVLRIDWAERVRACDSLIPAHSSRVCADAWHKKDDIT